MARGKFKRLAQRLKRNAARVSRGIASEARTDNEIAAGMTVASDLFLFSPEWRELRALALKRYGCRCAKCGAEQTKAKRMNVDHIKPRKFFPELALDLNNLQPLCGRCNKAKGNGPAIDYRSRVVPKTRPHEEAAEAGRES